MAATGQGPRRGQGCRAEPHTMHRMTLEPSHQRCTQQPCDGDHTYLRPHRGPWHALGQGWASVPTASCLQELLWQGQAKLKGSRTETPLGSSCTASSQQQGPSLIILPTGGPCRRQTQALSRVCCLVLPHILLEDSRSGWHSPWGHFPAQGQLHLLESQARQGKSLSCTSLGHGTTYMPFPAPASTAMATDGGAFVGQALRAQ